MNIETLKQYISTLRETWETYLQYRCLRAEGETTKDINLGASYSKYEQAAKDLQDELLINKTVYLTAGKDSITWLAKHMNITWPEYLPKGFEDVKGISTKLSNDLYEHVHRLRNKIVEDYSAKKTKGKKENTDFKSLFKNDQLYSKVISVLIQENLIDKNSKFWIDEKKGSKGLLIAILKDLKKKGYYREGNEITNQYYQQIAKEDFSVDVSIDTIKRPGTFNTNYISYA